MRASVSGLMALLVLWFFALNIFIHSLLASLQTGALQPCYATGPAQIKLPGCAHLLLLLLRSTPFVTLATTQFSDVPALHAACTIDVIWETNNVTKTFIVCHCKMA